MSKSMTEMAVFGLLRRVRLFAEVPAVELEAVARSSRSIRFRKAARVFEEGSSADCCYVLTSGRAKIVLSGSADAEIILGMIEPFALIGEVALLDNATRSAALIAVEDCHFIRIAKVSFLALRKNETFEERLVAHVTATLRRATEQLRAIYSFGSLERVMWGLARLAAQRGESQGTEITISPKPAHHELAEMTGCSRETVSRIFRRLKRSNKINWDRKALRLQAKAFGGYATDIPWA